MKKLLLSLLFLGASLNIMAKEVKYVNLTADSVKQIESLEKVDYLYNFTKLNIDLKKLKPMERVRIFADIILPSVKIVNLENQNTKDKMIELSKIKALSPKQEKYAKSIFQKYNVKYGDWKTLINNIIIYPNSLLIAQAGLESGWGTSRFFKEGFNIFGMWSVNPNEPRIRAGHKRANGKYIYVKKYQSPKEAISAFILNLSRNKAYKKLRLYINQGKTPYEIAAGLVNYSEEHELYVKKIRRTLKTYNLEKYDK